MNKVFIFLLGAGIGSLVTWGLIKEKYKKLADEEIESVVNYYKEKEEAKSRIVKVETFDTKIEEPFVNVIEDVPWATDEEKEEYENQIEELEYKQEDDDYTIKLDEVPEYVAPYVISPEEFGDKVGYDYKTMYYYADGVLAYEDDEIVSEPDNVIGDALDHFGEYEDDSVHVRDENIKCDYEILRSLKIFSEDVYKEDN